MSETPVADVVPTPPKLGQALQRLNRSCLVVVEPGSRLLMVGTVDEEVRVREADVGPVVAVATYRHRLAVLGPTHLRYFSQADGFHRSLPREQRIDRVYVPSSTHHVGHVLPGTDVGFSADGILWIAHRLFSAIVTLDDRHTFVPRWRPAFISQWAAEDRCHLSGIACDAVGPAFATVLADTDRRLGWQQYPSQSGQLIDIRQSREIARKLNRPHHPRLLPEGGSLLLIEGAAQRLVQIFLDREGARRELCSFNEGYPRSLAVDDGLVVIGVSRSRDVTAKGPSYLVLLDRSSMKLLGRISLPAWVTDVCAVCVLEGCLHPRLVTADADWERHPIWYLPASPVPLPKRDMLGLGVDESKLVTSPVLTAHWHEPTAAPGSREAYSASQLNEEGMGAVKNQRWSDAESLFRQALDRDSSNAAIWNNLGNVLRRQSRPAEAEQAYAAALVRDPSAIDTYVAISSLLRDMKRQREALGYLRQALSKAPTRSDVIINLVATHRELREWEQSLQLIAPFSSAADANFDILLAHANLLQELNEFDECEKLFGRVAKAVSNSRQNQARYYNAYGILQHRQNKLDSAASYFRKTIALFPEQGESHLHLAMTLLTQERYEQAWPEWEWRWKTPTLKYPPLKTPRWDGTPLGDRSLYLFGEQGIGDALQFLRVAAAVKKLYPGRYLIGCSKVLGKLLQQSKAFDQIVGDQIPPHDVHLALMTLLDVVKRRPEDLPAIDRVIEPDTARVAAWRKRVRGDAKFVIGIVWQGDPTYPADRSRSVPLTQYLPLTTIPGVRVVSLQKGYGVEQLTDLGPNAPFVNLGSEVDTIAGPFVDTAAIMDCLDLMVTSDTSIAHLAGLLHTRTWLATSFSPDWRWLLDKETTPWYPTMRLFRQRQPNVWTDVFERMRAEIVRLVDAL